MPIAHDSKVEVKTGIKEYDSLKVGSASLVGVNSDGKKLYLEVETFDGEHSNRFEPEFPLETSAEEITEYLKSLIEKNPKVSPEVISLLQKKLFWDALEESYYWQTGNQKAVRIKAKGETHTDHKK